MPARRSYSTAELSKGAKVFTLGLATAQYTFGRADVASPGSEGYPIGGSCRAGEVKHPRGAKSLSLLAMAWEPPCAFPGGDHATRVPCNRLSGTSARECPETVRDTGLDNVATVATRMGPGLISRVQEDDRFEGLALAERLLRLAEERIPGHHGQAGRKPLLQMSGTRKEIQPRKERPE